MSNSDSGRPGRRLVLRKIGAPNTPPLPAPRVTARVTPPPAPLPEPAPVARMVEVEFEGTKSPNNTAAPAPVLARRESAHEAREVTPLPAPRPTQTTYGSLPPVSATVITPLSTVLGAPGEESASSRWKGVVGGTVVGLALVSAFIIGARLSQSSIRSSAAGQIAPATSPVVTAPLEPVTVGAVAPVSQPVAAPAHTVDTLPVVAATALPVAPPPVRWNPPVSGPRSVGLPAPAAKAPVASVDSPPPAAPAVSAPAAASATQADAPPEETQSLVPVIPPSAPPEADPLVKAVQSDIEEEQARRKRK